VKEGKRELSLRDLPPSCVNSTSDWIGRVEVVERLPIRFAISLIAERVGLDQLIASVSKTLGSSSLDRSRIGRPVAEPNNATHHPYWPSF